MSQALCQLFCIRSSPELCEAGIKSPHTTDEETEAQGGSDLAKATVDKDPAGIRTQA